MEMLLEKYKQIGVFEKFKDEIEYMFIRTYYINSITAFVGFFDSPDFDKILTVREFMNNNFPNYKENIYFKKDYELRKNHFEITKFFTKLQRLKKMVF